MANALTRKGVESLLERASGASTSAGESGLAFAATAILLMHSSSTPTTNPTDATYGAIGASGKSFFEVASGNGYTAGGNTINETNWAYDAANGRITLDDNDRGHRGRVPDRLGQPSPRLLGTHRPHACGR